MNKTVDSIILIVLIDDFILLCNEFTIRDGNRVALFIITCGPRVAILIFNVIFYHEVGSYCVKANNISGMRSLFLANYIV